MLDASSSSSSLPSAPTIAQAIAARLLASEKPVQKDSLKILPVAAAAAAPPPSSSAPLYRLPPPLPGPSPGPSPGTECLRAAADEVSAAAAAYTGWINKMTSAVERREARSNHRRQLGALLHGQKSVAAGLVAVLLAAEGLVGGDAVIVSDVAGDEVAVGEAPGGAFVSGGGNEGAGELGFARRRVLSYATSLRAACEAGQAVEATRAAASLWEQRAGDRVIECLRENGRRISGGRGVEEDAAPRANKIK